MARSVSTSFLGAALPAAVLAGGCGDGAPTPDVTVFVRATVDGEAYEGGSTGAVWYGAEATPSLDLWPADALQASLLASWSPGDTGSYALGDDDAAEAMLVWIPEAGQEYCSTSGTLTVDTWNSTEEAPIIGTISGTFAGTLEGCLGVEGAVEVTDGRYASLVEDASSRR